MITTILFDLDGTLLPMEETRFLKAYMGSISARMAKHGYDPELLIKSIWQGTGAMVTNDGSVKNETIFWQTFSSAYGRDTRADEAIFEDFYHKEFQSVKNACGYDARAAQVISELKKSGYQLVLATNPLFPAVATHSRVRWAGLSPTDFSLITTYENSSFCKPKPDYYREILGKLNLSAENCLMVGNHTTEDMVAAEIGMKVFLLTDCLINKAHKDITQFPNGSFPELMTYIRSL